MTTKARTSKAIQQQVVANLTKLASDAFGDSGDVVTKSAPTQTPTTIRKGYGHIDELPEHVKSVLDEHAQSIWLDWYNWQYVDEELNNARAEESAWNEIRWYGYIKGNDGMYQIAKADDQREMLVKLTKVDTDKRLVYGWANQCIDTNGDAVDDSQGDVITKVESIEAFEDAVTQYMLDSRQGDEMHVNFGVAEIVESVFFTVEKQEAMGVPADTFPVAWWVGFKVHDDATWEGVKSGEYPMMSIVGSGTRSEIEE